jgi:hypothetical protein
MAGLILAVCGIASGGSTPKIELYLADLPLEDVQAVQGTSSAAEWPKDPARLLDRLSEVIRSFRFDTGLVTIHADGRWFGAQSRSGPGSPFFELRRWPGDSVIAFYALPGQASSEEGAWRAFGAASFSRSVSEDKRMSRWEGTLDTTAGARPAEWIERSVGPEAAAHLGVLMVAGDAGLGAESIAATTEEMFSILRRLEIDPDRWASEPGTAAGDPLVAPETGGLAGEGDEKTQPWQVIEGRDFTLSLPPGIRARRLDRGMPPPRPVAGGLLWFRGRFTDRTGLRVVVGDTSRSAYVAEVVPVTPEWRAGRSPPIAAPGSRSLIGLSFAEAEETTGASLARAERWEESGFEGNWIVFRLAFADRGVEIGLPIVAGRQSQALFWIPLTWRGAGQLPAPPPMDPAERFDIRFSRFVGTDQRAHPWSQGYLEVPGLRAEIPKGWEPVANVRTETGFPVSIVDGEGRVIGRLMMVEKTTQELPPRDSEGWVALKRPSLYRAASAYKKADGSLLLVDRDGGGFLLERIGEVRADPSLWDRLLETVTMIPSREKREGNRRKTD